MSYNQKIDLPTLSAGERIVMEGEMDTDKYFYNELIKIASIFFIPIFLMILGDLIMIKRDIQYYFLYIIVLIVLIILIFFARKSARIKKIIVRFNQYFFISNLKIFIINDYFDGVKYEEIYFKNVYKIKKCKNYIEIHSSEDKKTILWYNDIDFPAIENLRISNI